MPRNISLIGAPTDVGAGVRGASMGPEALRVAGIVPVSALRGDNVTLPAGASTAWFQGPSLLQLLHTLPTTQERTQGALLLPVLAPQDGLMLHHRVASGTLVGYGTVLAELIPHSPG